MSYGSDIRGVFDSEMKLDFSAAQAAGVGQGVEIWSGLARDMAREKPDVVECGLGKEALPSVALD